MKSSRQLDEKKPAGGTNRPFTRPALENAHRERETGTKSCPSTKRKNRSLPHAHREERGRHEEQEPPLSVIFIPRVCKSPDPKAGGRSHARPLVGRKGGRVFLRIRTFAHAGRPFSLKLKALEGDPATLSAWCCSRRKKRWRRGDGRRVEQDGGGMMLARE